MARVWKSGIAAILATALAIASPVAHAEEKSEESEEPCVEQLEVTPKEVMAEVGDKVQFSAVGKDASGETVEEEITWFAAPWTLGGAEESGLVTLHAAGKVLVGAVMCGKTAYANILVNAPPVVSVNLAPVTTSTVIGGTLQLGASAHDTSGYPVEEVGLTWISENPSVAMVDAAGLVTALSAGRATLRVKAGEASDQVTIDVVKDKVLSLSVEPSTSSARTGDVIYFTARAMFEGDSAAENLAVRWTVSGAGAGVWPDGAFVAERPGSYVVQASIGQRAAVASVVVTPRGVEREIEVLSHILVNDVQAAEQWVIGDYAFLSTISDRVMSYDISDPSEPKLLDTLTVDARLINDVSTTPDGRIGVITREGSSDRKNGIVFIDTSDPTDMKVISEYTETVTGGVHSAYIDGHYVYLTDDSTGSLRVIDFENVKEPKEVARWEIEVPTRVVQTSPDTGGQVSSGRYLHDLVVRDGLAYLAYLQHGLIILDVGHFIKGGSPENPQLVSQVRFNYRELYGDGWLGGAHTVFVYKNYVFVGDEVFPAEFDIEDKSRIPVRGIIHVVDASDIENPIKVAEYNVPEAGAHNVWLEDDILYMGYFNAGARIVDVSGELRGDLYRQGREIARLWTGDPEGYRPNIPFAWGAQPHGDLVFFNDMHTGMWITRLGDLKQYKGSTTPPPMVEKPEKAD